MSVVVDANVDSGSTLTLAPGPYVEGVLWNATRDTSRAATTAGGDVRGNTL